MWVWRVGYERVLCRKTESCWPIHLSTVTSGIKVSVNNTSGSRGEWMTKMRWDRQPYFGIDNIRLHQNITLLYIMFCASLYLVFSASRESLLAEG